MKLVPTRRTDYAIRALLFLAQNSEGRIKALEISEAMDIPKGFLHQILQALQRAHLVVSRRSRQGGYALARSPDQISLLEIVESMEGPLDAGECALQGGPCHWEEVCALHWVWASAREALAERLGQATLAQIAADDRALAEGTKPVPQNAHRRRRKTRRR